MLVQCLISLILCLSCIQITARREVDDEMRLNLQLDIDEEKEAEQMYDDMLKNEAQKMSARGFQPKVNEYNVLYIIVPDGSVVEVGVS